MEGFVMTWWIWFLVGLALLLTEFLTPGAFFQFFFGLGAIALGLVELAGIQFPLSVQLLLFLVLSFGSLILLRNNGFGKAELRGTAWNARNVGDTPIAESQRCRVERVDGLTLWVRLATLPRRTRRRPHLVGPPVTRH